MFWLMYKWWTETWNSRQRCYCNQLEWNDLQIQRFVYYLAVACYRMGQGFSLQRVRLQWRLAHNRFGFRGGWQFRFGGGDGL